MNSASHEGALASVVFSCKLFVTLELDCLEIGFGSRKSTFDFGVSGLLPTDHEKPKETFICTPGRTNNRIRSPRLAVSGQ